VPIFKFSLGVGEISGRNISRNRKWNIRAGFRRWSCPCFAWQLLSDETGVTTEIGQNCLHVEA